MPRGLGVRVPPFAILTGPGSLSILPGRRYLQEKKEKPGSLRKRVWILPFVALACTLCSLRTVPEQRLLLRSQIVALAVTLAGVPYRFGGVDIDGFDCSGLVFYIYDCFGIKVPRSAREQGSMAGTVKLKLAAPGDILVFKFARVWHTAIYLGNGRFIHAPNAGGWVRLEKLNEYWLSRLRKVKTVWPDAG
jgi:hypothetical protein